MPTVVACLSAAEVASVAAEVAGVVAAIGVPVLVGAPSVMVSVIGSGSLRSSRLRDHSRERQSFMYT
jgi:hypothetical protein